MERTLLLDRSHRECTRYNMRVGLLYIKPPPVGLWLLTVYRLWCLVCVCVCPGMMTPLPVCPQGGPAAFTPTLWFRMTKAVHHAYVCVYESYGDAGAPRVYCNTQTDRSFRIPDHCTAPRGGSQTSQSPGRPRSVRPIAARPSYFLCLISLPAAASPCGDACRDFSSRDARVTSAAGT